ncbi:MAG: alcohol dehydrogenase catalytic domain-containing protein [Candidatus Azotimanducaceae bacterium]
MHRSRNAPEVLGHESTGEVLEVGSEVSHVAPGDTVMVTWVPRSIVPGDRVPQAAQGRTGQWRRRHLQQCLHLGGSHFGG